MLHMIMDMPLILKFPDTFLPIKTICRIPDIVQDTSIWHPEIEITKKKFNT